MLPGKETGMTPDLLHAILLLELVNASARIGQLLLAGIERMALGTDFNVKILLRGTGLPGLTACTTHGCRAVLRMNSFLHDFHLAFRVALSVCQT